MPSLGQYLDFFSRALCLSFLISGRGEGGGGRRDDICKSVIVTLSDLYGETAPQPSPPPPPPR